MVIGFKPQFVPKIMDGTKKHTIREVRYNKPVRWKPGMLMHMATGVRTKKYKEFTRLKCVSVQYIRIWWGLFEIKNNFPTIHIVGFKKDGSQTWHKLNHEEIIKLSKNDGFEDVLEFLNFFKYVYSNTKEPTKRTISGFQEVDDTLSENKLVEIAKKIRCFDGMIIHWTYFGYGGEKRKKGARRRYHLHNMLRYRYNVKAYQKIVEVNTNHEVSPRNQKYMNELAGMGYNIQYVF